MTTAQRSAECAYACRSWIYDGVWPAIPTFSFSMRPAAVGADTEEDDGGDAGAPRVDHAILVRRARVEP